MDRGNVTSSFLLTSLVATISPPSFVSQCHCSAGRHCNVVTSTCPDGCETGWSGPCCWRGDISFRSIALQSSTYGEKVEYATTISNYSADKVVDGKLPAIPNDYTFCSISIPSTAFWWYIWLNGSREYIIETVTITLSPGPESTDVSSNLPCHCLNNSRCGVNGFCSIGCELGWYGPGCQIGNLAFRKPTKQSSTLNHLANPTSEKGVDGFYPMTGDIIDYCIHTDGKIKVVPWWTVTLDPIKLFVILNVTIVGRANEQRLRHYTVWYGNDSEAPWANWRPYASHSFYNRERFMSYRSDKQAVGRAVSVSLTFETTDPLIFCELYVDGYEYSQCPDGFTGPGCLLYKCDSDICRKYGAGECGQYDSCRFIFCPNKARLPPECWMPVDSALDYSVLITPSTTGNPNLINWEHCARSDSNTSAYSRSFDCRNGLARRVGMISVSNAPKLVILCEVTVTGYPKGDVKSICPVTQNTTLPCNCGSRERCDEATGICTKWCQEGLSHPDCEPCPTGDPTMTLTSWYRAGLSGTVSCRDTAAAGFNVSVTFDFGHALRSPLMTSTLISLSTTRALATIVPDKSWNGITITCTSLLKRCPSRSSSSILSVYYLERISETVAIAAKASEDSVGINCMTYIFSNPDAVITVNTSTSGITENAADVTIYRSDLPAGTTTAVATCQALNQAIMESISVTVRIAWQESLFSQYLKWCDPWCLYILAGGIGIIVIATCSGCIVMCKQNKRQEATVGSLMNPDVLNYERVTYMQEPKRVRGASAGDLRANVLSSAYSSSVNNQRGKTPFSGTTGSTDYGTSLGTGVFSSTFNKTAPSSGPSTTRTSALTNRKPKMRAAGRKVIAAQQFYPKKP